MVKSREESIKQVNPQAENAREPAPSRFSPLRCPDLGIRATTREVANRASLGTFGPHHARISVARISCLEKLGAEP